MSMTMQEKQQLVQELNAEIRKCTKCPLHQGRTHAVPGEGPLNAKVMFIGEGPGAMEDRTGRPFVGPAGQFLNELLALAGLKREEVFIANTVKCFISPRVLIYTADGYKPIKDIKIGDLVLTHKGQFRRVVYVRPRENLPKGSEIVQLTVRSMDGTNTRPLKVTVTPEHPFFINGEWKSAHAIQVGDRMGALGDRCEVCGRTYFVRYDRYECRTYRTCSYRCHNLRIYHNPEAREKVRRTMHEQYANGQRDRSAITKRANERVRELVVAGRAKLQNLTSEERHRGRVALAANVTKGLRGGNRIGFGEEELKVILERLGVDYVHQFAFPNSSYLYDFCLPYHQILIEVRGPSMQPSKDYQGRMLAKDALAKENGYIVLNLWWAQIIEHPDMVEALLERLLKNHAGEYTFVDVEVIRVERRVTQRVFPLYNIGVEEDESYVVSGLVSHNCRPPENRTPTTDEIAACNDYLVAQIALIQPKVICLLGSPALKTMLGAEYQISKVHGQVFEKEGMTFVPMFHPAAALHQDRYKIPLREDFVKLKGILAKELSRET